MVRNDGASKHRHREERSDVAISVGAPAPARANVGVASGGYSLRSPFGPACGRSTRFALLCRGPFGASQ